MCIISRFRGWKNCLNFAARVASRSSVAPYHRTVSGWCIPPKTQSVYSGSKRKKMLLRLWCESQMYRKTLRHRCTFASQPTRVRYSWPNGMAMWTHSRLPTRARWTLLRRLTRRKVPWRLKIDHPLHLIQFDLMLYCSYQRHTHIDYSVALWNVLGVRWILLQHCRVQVVDKFGSLDALVEFAQI